MLIPEENRINFLKEHTVEYYLEIFEGTIAMKNKINMTIGAEYELLNEIIILRMIKIIEDHCEN